MSKNQSKDKNYDITDVNWKKTNKLLKQYNISKDEIKKIGINLKDYSPSNCYGKDMPDDVFDEIVTYCHGRSRTKNRGFILLEDGEFQEVLDFCLKEFSGVISQEDLGRAVGITQEKIAKMRYYPVTLTCEKQKEILEYFYYACFSDKRLLSPIYEQVVSKLASVHVDPYMFILRRNMMQDWIEKEHGKGTHSEEYKNEIAKLKNSEYRSKIGLTTILSYDGMPEEYLEDFKLYRTEIQNIILQNFDVFCSDFLWMRTYKKCLEWYKNAPEEKKKSFLIFLERNIDEKSNIDYDSYVFKKCTSFRRIIGILLDDKDFFKNSKNKKPGKDKKQVKRYNEFRMKINDVRSSSLWHINFPSQEKWYEVFPLEEEECAMTGETTEIFVCSRPNKDMMDIELTPLDYIDYKLAFSAEEWYVWMQLNCSKLSDYKIWKKIETM